MSHPSNSHDPMEHAVDGPDGPVRYPAGQVLGIIDAQETAAEAVKELQASGFLDSEIRVGTGPKLADAVGASTGHTGLARFMTRLADRLGVEDVEMEFKGKYERAMRDGGFVVLVATPTEERKALAAEILRSHAAHTVTFHGRFTIESFEPPEGP
jgi:hypothetical protein